MAPLGRSLGTSSSPGGTLGVGSLGTGPLGGGSLGRGSLGGSSLGGSLGKNSLNGSLNTTAKGGLGSGGRFPTAEQHKDPFQQARLGGIKDPPGVRRKYFCMQSKTYKQEGVRILSLFSSRQIEKHTEISMLPVLQITFKVRESMKNFEGSIALVASVYHSFCCVGKPVFEGFFI